MPRIPRETVDEVRERTDIAEVIQRHVALKARGRNLVGLCPFHQEKTPSFNVIPDKGIFHCFGCQMGGDVFKFVMQLEGLSFAEAVRELAQAAGVEIHERELSPAERQAMRQRASLFDVLDAAGKFFEGQLWTHADGAEARAYLERRGITQETARAWGLGWAPGGPRLLDHMGREGFTAQQVAEVGLARESNRGTGYYPFLRDRVIVPIRDVRRRPIAYAGRLLEGDGPKYINTPETRLYAKSKVLYGLDAARGPIQQRGRVLVVEGYFDVLSLHQAGFPEAIATCGTALTPDHLALVRRLTRDVVLLMDADEAGLRAAERSLPAFVDAGIQPWRLSLPGAKDPDELIQESGPEAMEAALAQREPLFEWVVGRKLEQYGQSAMSRDRVLDEVLDLLRKLQDPALVSSVSRRLGVQEATVLERLRRAPRPAPPPAGSEEPAEPSWRPNREVVHLLWLLVHRYDQVSDVVARIGPSVLDEHPQVRKVIARLVAGEPVASIDDPDPQVVRTLNAIVARDELYEEESAASAVVDILVRLLKPARASRVARITADLDRLERAGDTDGVRETITQKAALLAQQRQMDAALERGDLAEIKMLLGSTAADKP